MESPTISKERVKKNGKSMHSTKKKTLPKEAEDLGTEASLTVDDVIGEDRDEVLKSKHLDLGCCCVCHDDQVPGVPTDCPWCVGCSVNNPMRSDVGSKDTL